MKLVTQMIGIVVTLMLSLVPLAGAQGPGADITRVFQLEHVRPDLMERTLGLFDARILSNNDLNTLSVRARPEIMVAIEETIARLDVLELEQAVELTMHIMQASNTASGASLPQELEPVVQQLRNVFSYQSFQIVDTVVLRALDGTTAQASGTIRFADLPREIPTLYNFSAEFRVVSEDDGPTMLRLREMRTGFQVPVRTNDETGYRYTNVGINTDVDIQTGQQIVVGKSTVGDNALILVMSAEFLD